MARLKYYFAIIQLTHGGQVEFVTETEDRLVGYWIMESSEGGNNQESGGTWVLSKALGRTASHGH